MPSKTERQQRFMGADLARAEKGEKTKTGMSKDKLREFASKPKGRATGKERGNARR